MLSDPLRQEKEQDAPCLPAGTTSCSEDSLQARGLVPSALPGCSSLIRNPSWVLKAVNTRRLCSLARGRNQSTVPAGCL